MSLVTQHTDPAGSETALAPGAFRHSFIAGLPVLLLALLMAGCVTRQAARNDARTAYQTGLRDGRTAADSRRTKVIFEGPVRQQMIEWREGITLGEAIVEAVYLPPNDPREIVIHRERERIAVIPAELLAGAVVALEPGDIVELVP
ncbi:MAG TPA: hypothetical protein DCY13_04145 [Verrucomicrobiales bacterium]|nr:hypothetical protein [Verrucomicrobiales bacterium]